MEFKNAKWIADKTPDGKTVLNSKDHIHVEIDGVVCDVPVDPANRHYAAIQEWVAEGNTIEEAD